MFHDEITTNAGGVIGPRGQTPLGLRERIIADYTARPVRRTAAPRMPHERTDL
jgi:hypothetical protein